MTKKEFTDFLKSFGLPYKYHHFTEEDEPQELESYMVYDFPESADFYADNINYANVQPLDIRFYFQSKDIEKEQEVETLFAAAEIPYSKTETWIEEEQLFEILYESEVFIQWQTQQTK